MTEEKRNFFGLTAKVVIVNENNEVLVIKRSKSDLIGPGKYDLPGGKIEFGENISEAALREVEEELGIEVELGPVIYVFDFGEEFNKEYAVGKEKVIVAGKGIRFLAFYKKGEIKLSNEHEKYEWLDFKKALERFGDSSFEKDKVESIKRAEKYLEMQKAQENLKRLAADFENYKKRQEQARKEWAQFSNENMILQILPVLDNFHASTEHIPEDRKDNPWVVGIMHIQKQLEKVLEDNGVSEIQVKEGDEFNPEIHEAIKADNEKLKTKNRISKIVMKGYKIGPARNASHSDAGGGRIIRAVKVIVE